MNLAHHRGKVSGDAQAIALAFCLLDDRHIAALSEGADTSDDMFVCIGVLDAPACIPNGRMCCVESEPGTFVQFQDYNLR